MNEFIMNKACDQITVIISLIKMYLETFNFPLLKLIHKYLLFDGLENCNFLGSNPSTSRLIYSDHKENIVFVCDGLFSIIII